MSANKLEQLRERLNSMLAAGDTDFEEVLKVSKALDVLVVQSIKSKTGKGFGEAGEDRAGACGLDDFLDKRKLVVELLREIAGKLFIGDL